MKLFLNKNDKRADEIIALCDTLRELHKRFPNGLSVIDTVFDSMLVLDQKDMGMCDKYEGDYIISELKKAITYYRIRIDGLCVPPLYEISRELKDDTQKSTFSKILTREIEKIICDLPDKVKFSSGGLMSAIHFAVYYCGCDYDDINRLTKLLPAYDRVPELFRNAYFEKVTHEIVRYLAKNPIKYPNERLWMSLYQITLSVLDIMDIVSPSTMNIVTKSLTAMFLMKTDLNQRLVQRMFENKSDLVNEIILRRVYEKLSSTSREWQKNACEKNACEVVDQNITRIASLYTRWVHIFDLVDPNNANNKVSIETEFTPDSPMYAVSQHMCCQHEQQVVSCKPVLSPKVLRKLADELESIEQIIGDVNAETTAKINDLRKKGLNITIKVFDYTCKYHYEKVKVG